MEAREMQQAHPPPLDGAPARRPVRRAARRQWAFVGAVLLLLGLLLGLGWQSRDRFQPMEVGSSAPDFAAQDLEGRTVSLGELRGEVVLLNVWATWCPPCIEEMPSMQRLHDRLAPDGLRVVAVSIDAAAGARDRSGRPGGDVGAFAERLGVTFDIWRDPAGEIQRIYRTTGVPESFVIDRDGVIIKKVIGATDWDSPGNVALLARLLRGS